jgi:hypothetical protein
MPKSVGTGTSAIRIFLVHVDVTVAYVPVRDPGGNAEGYIR